MIHRAKDLSVDQKVAIESLLGRSMAEDEAISIHAMNPASGPKWLRESWKSAAELGMNLLSSEDIDAEIQATRLERRVSARPIDR